MASLSAGTLSLECDGSVVSCVRDGVVVATAAVPEDKTSPLDFGDVQVCLNPSEWRELLGLVEEVAENVTAEEETPVVSKKRRRS